MAEQPRKTITCPRCSNVNPYAEDACIKCDLPLGPIRDTMAGAGTGTPATVETPAEPASPATPKEPAPPLQELPERPTEETTWTFVDSWRFLTRGMGDRAEEIAARFFKQLADRGIDGLKLAW